MHRIIYFALIGSLAIFGLMTIVTATDQPMMMTGLSNSDGTLKLNDSTVNNAINEFPFFILDCYVPWCEPCKSMGTALYELASELRGQVTIGLIDIENNSLTAKKFNIASYPTLLIFKNGILVDSQAGYSSKSELVDLIQMDDPGLNASNIELAASSKLPVTPTKSNSTQMTTLVPIRDLMT